MTRFVVILLLGALVALAQGEVPKEYSSYRLIPWCTPSDYVRYPKSAEDVQAIIQEAIKRKVTVKAFGSRHSQTDIICTEGIPMYNRGLKGKTLNADGTATFGAGVRMHEATLFLRKHGRGFKTTPAFGMISLSGAIGTGAHGSSIRYTPSISSQVVGLTIVDGKGEIRNITDEGDLKAFRLHLGLLGIIVSITLKSAPLYKVRAHNYIVPDEILLNGTANRWAVEVDQMTLYWFPSTSQVVVANWTIVDVSTPGFARTNDHVPSTSAKFNRIISRAQDIIQKMATSGCPQASSTGYSLLHGFERYFQSTLVQQTPMFVPIYTEDEMTTQNPAVGYYDKMFAPTCTEEPGAPLQCIWGHGEFHRNNLTILNSEMSVPLEVLPKLIARAKDVFSKTPVAFPLLGILFRFSGNTSTYMSTAYGRDTVHFEFYLVNRKNQTKDAGASLAAYQTILQVIVNEFGGRAHWGKNGLVYHNKQMLEKKLDPSAKAHFLATMDKYDPEGRFMNNFGRRLKGLGDTLDSDPQATRCALMDYCLCSKDSDCGEHQTCTKVTGYDYPACQTIGETKIPVPPPQDNPNLFEWLDNSLPAFADEMLAKPECSGK